MSKKRRRNRNPLLKKKYDEGYKDGIAQAVNFFREKFEGLEDVEGIGEKTMYKIKMHLGEKYFKG